MSHPLKGLKHLTLGMGNQKLMGTLTSAKASVFVSFFISVRFTCPVRFDSRGDFNVGAVDYEVLDVLAPGDRSEAANVRNVGPDWREVVKDALNEKGIMAKHILFRHKFSEYIRKSVVKDA